MGVKRNFYFSFLVFFVCLNLFGQEDDSWNLTERADFSRYDNNKYIGHVYREVRASINKDGKEVGGFSPYKATFIILEETLRDMRASARALDDVIPVRFKMANNGAMHIENDKGYPALRNFPVYSIASIKESLENGGGEAVKWTAEGKRAVDPLNNGNIIVYPFLAEYEYKGTEIYKGINVHHITALYACRYYPSNNENEKLKSITGNHNVDILVNVENGMLVLQRDQSDETFLWRDGNSTRFRGFTLTFGQGLPAIDKPAIMTIIKSTKDIDVEAVDNGIRLRIKDLRFKPDSEELLPGEESRLDSIAKTLLSVSDRTFLVEGHTAHIGNPDNEMDLSVKRAQRLVEEMQARGISPTRFVYKGYGGTKPVGDNSTDEGRRANRRVEITILQ